MAEAVEILAPNGQADINHFHAAGGTGTLFRGLLDAGLMHGEAMTIWGQDFNSFSQEPGLQNNKLVWRDSALTSLDQDVLTTMAQPFASEGGLRLLTGNLGKGII